MHEQIREISGAQKPRLQRRESFGKVVAVRPSAHWLPLGVGHSRLIPTGMARSGPGVALAGPDVAVSSPIGVV